MQNSIMLDFQGPYGICGKYKKIWGIPFTQVSTIS